MARPSAKRYLIPPETGDYVFWVCGDDDIDLFISTTINPRTERLVAQETTWSAALAWISSAAGQPSRRTLRSMVA